MGEGESLGDRPHTPRFTKLGMKGVQYCTNFCIGFLLGISLCEQHKGFIVLIFFFNVKVLLESILSFWLGTHFCYMLV